MGYGADVCTGGTPTAESAYSGSYDADKAFDDNVAQNDVWNSAASWAPTEWIKYDFGVGVTKVAAQYTMRCYNNGTQNQYYPTAWKFQGSNNDSDWTDIDEQTAQTFTINVKNTYNSFSNSTAYRYYRWLVSAVAGGTTYVVINELEIMELDVVAPTVTTQDATSVTDSGCTGNGEITATGGANATRRGFCYMEGTSGDPTTADSVAYDDGDYGTGAYTKAISGLSAETGYRVRAYAVNSAGTAYGSTVQVTTEAVASSFTPRIIMIW